MQKECPTEQTHHSTSSGLTRLTQRRVGAAPPLLGMRHEPRILGGATGAEGIQTITVWRVEISGVGRDSDTRERVPSASGHNRRTTFDKGVSNRGVNFSCSPSSGSRHFSIGFLSSLVGLVGMAFQCLRRSPNGHHPLWSGRGEQVEMLTGMRQRARLIARVGRACIGAFHGCSGHIWAESVLWRCKTRYNLPT
jgi:hypothetical protein